MKVATWNVNSIRARKERLLAWLTEHAPDVLCLQELKVEDHEFPHAEIEAAGYRAAVHGQKTYHGVAILSRVALEQCCAGLGDDEGDAQARLLSAVIGGVRVLSVYAPNGGELTSERYAYKLAWYERLMRYLERECRRDQPLLLCGDLNIAPADLDVARPDEWRESVLCAPQAREAFTKLAAWGFIDCLRQLHPTDAIYSWWDYRQLAFPKGNGLRIDHVLATPSLAQRCRAIAIDRQQRKGKLPSDHAPVIAEFDWPG